MADLLTHLAVARLPGAFVRDRSVQALLVAGTFLPDIAAKGLQGLASSPSGFVLPTHSAPGLLVLSYLLSLFVEEVPRRAAFLALYAGSLIHVGVDLLKDNLGAGSVYVFYPFSVRRVEWGCIYPENVVLLLPASSALLALAWIIEGRLRRVRR